MKAIFQVIIFYIEKPLGRKSLIFLLEGIERNEGCEEKKINMKTCIGNVEETQSSISCRLFRPVSDFEIVRSKTNSQLDTLTSTWFLRD
jgi:hypothetical protein